MSYLERALGADERIEYSAKTHWIVYVLPALFVPIFGIGLLFLLFTWLYMISTELGVTNRRVIGKWGFISRRTMEQRLDKIEGVQVHQDLIGRLLDYGTIIVTGTGGSGTPIPNIADPLGFRAAVDAAMDTYRQVPAAPAPVRENDAKSRLETLEQLRREGLINDEEYASRRAQIIAAI